MNKKIISDLTKAELEGKKVLVRVDFNVPIRDGVITDDIRIKSSLPTINYLTENGAKVIIMAHLGRPKGQVKEELRLNLIAAQLDSLTKTNVQKADDCIGAKVEDTISKMNNGDIVLLENIRFYKEETDNDEEFAKKLANLADLYVNDAFGTAHRAHASTAGVAKFLPAYGGFLIAKELDFLGGSLSNPKQPLVAIIGGAKVSSKIGVLKNLLDKVGKEGSIIIGGGMAYTFDYAKGLNVGKSLLEKEYVEVAKEFMAKAEEMGVKVLYPVDTVVADNFAEDANTQTVDADKIPDGWMGLDIGPKSIKLFADEINKAKTVIWNGPMGVFELNKFAAGTNVIAQTLADSDAISIVGGGDSAAAIEKAGLADKISHISTGGGASLEFIEGKVLPGIAVLQDK